MEVFDLTNDDKVTTESISTKKRKNSDGQTKPSSTNNKKIAKKDTAHVLLWICSHGKGQGRTWSGKALRVIGVYSSKQMAEEKKDELMNRYDNCGHGDILVGGTCWDEIDLVVRAVEEVNM